MGRQNNRQKKGSFSSFLPDPTSSSVEDQIQLSLKRMATNSTIPTVISQKEQTTERLLRIQMKTSNLSNLQLETTTIDRNLDLIKRRTMLMQIDMNSRYAPTGLRNAGFGRDALLPLMSGNSARPNVFETREERRRRLLDEER